MTFHRERVSTQLRRDPLLSASRACALLFSFFCENVPLNVSNSHFVMDLFPISRVLRLEAEVVLFG